MIQSASPGQFLALSQGETDSRASSISKRLAIRHERMLLLVSVCVLLLSLSLSLTVVTTDAASSPLTAMHSSVRPPLSSSPAVSVKHSSSGNTTIGGETGVIPLTLVDLIGTFVAALIPALLGCLFIVAGQRSLRKRQQQGWAGWIQLVQEQGQLGGLEEAEVESEVVDTQEREQQRLRNEVQTDALELLSQVAIINGQAHSRLSRLKCRLRSLPEPLPPG